ncbi:hypothetical protein CYMTET_28838 [Cymbomonas tetramitiformis]|uniref:Uncharacterized protein n=1 Tax=Cymbomonas tetramitiformis TaxID=36881 RepID=A0AAE0KVU2_9CHLO|nr:hypothetical protein CYMTET_28838 [Cymbomonas tetramitiformis]
MLYWPVMARTNRSTPSRYFDESDDDAFDDSYECVTLHFSSSAVQLSSMDKGFPDDEGGGLFEASEAEFLPPQFYETGNASLVQEGDNPVVHDYEDYNAACPLDADDRDAHDSGSAYGDDADHYDSDSGGSGYDSFMGIILGTTELLNGQAGLSFPMFRPLADTSVLRCLFCTFVFTTSGQLLFNLRGPSYDDESFLPTGPTFSAAQPTGNLFSF